MSKTNLGLIEFAKSKLGTNYVYGTKGEVLTQSKYDWLKSTYGEKAVWISDEKKVSTICVDCSGLISWYTGMVRGSSQYYSLNKPQPISTIADAPLGSAVWHSGHIGIYIGNGKCIEAKGSAYGTVISNLSSCKFTHWFTLSDISYIDEAKTENTEIQAIQSIQEIVIEVIQGKWGNGEDRKTRLELAGYDYSEIQKAVNSFFE